MRSWRTERWATEAVCRRCEDWNLRLPTRTQATQSPNSPRPDRNHAADLFPDQGGIGNRPTQDLVSTPTSIHVGPSRRLWFAPTHCCSDNKLHALVNSFHKVLDPAQGAISMLRLDLTRLPDIISVCDSN